MHVGVLGGGLQGCCVALALAERGVKVTILDRNEDLLTRAAVANEGKIHLGYMYAADRTLSTARTMMRGALAFGPFFLKYLGLSRNDFSLSHPASYVVHRNSQYAANDAISYFHAVHSLIQELAASNPHAYFEADLRRPLRVWSEAERGLEFDLSQTTGAVDTPEVAIDPLQLAQSLRRAVSTHPLIEVRLGQTVSRAEEHKAGIAVCSNGRDGWAQDSFDHVINALWDGRLALNETLGIRANRPWLHRLKYGVSFRIPEDGQARRSATFVSGPFGEVVRYPTGLTYLTWYPECVKGMSSDLSPPDWATYPAEPIRSDILLGTCKALSKIVIPLRDIDPTKVADVCVKGGVIVAWGNTDIYDPGSELHRRFEIGVQTTGNFHSIDPGKLTMIPYFAEICADRIKPLN